MTESKYSVVDYCIMISFSLFFRGFILACIIVSSIMIGFETYPAISRIYGDTIDFTHRAILWIFLFELVVRIIAYGKRPWRFFFDGWNIFDFFIIAVCFLPFNAAYASIFRILRLLRTLRLISLSRELQNIVATMIRIIPSIGYISLIMCLYFYIFGILATYNYQKNDPVHFGDLHTSVLTLFRVVTLEDWTDVMYIQMYGCDKYGYGDNMDRCTHPESSPLGGALFFVIFVIGGSMIIINLFVAAAVDGMNESKMELATQGDIKRNEVEYIELYEFFLLNDDKISPAEKKILHRKGGKLGLSSSRIAELEKSSDNKLFG
ncbi:MAG: ion transporter [Proteobacteria bacterium]|nr:ion transporter [Pseudomonadota bacterium]